MKTKILFPFLIFLSISLIGQNFDNKITSSKFSIEDKEYPAFKSFFDFKPEQVEKGWWKYSRQFGKPMNMRKYYQVTVPREMDGIEVAIILYSKPVASGKGASFILALDDLAIPESKRAEYLSQLKLILIEFKRQFYLESYEEELKAITKEAEKNGNLASKLTGEPREELLEKLQLLNYDVEQVKSKISALQK